MVNIVYKNIFKLKFIYSYLLTIILIMNTNKSSFKVIDVKSSNQLVEIKESTYIKDNLSKGLFAKKDIKKGTPLVIYFGDVLDEEELMEKYQENKDIMKYVRKGYDFIVDGSIGYDTKNINLSGVYVNDIMKLKSTSMKDMEHYHKSRMICNVEVMNTSDFPVYVAKRDIKKGQELFVHYGIHYWLHELGVHPIDLKRKYKNILKRFN